MDTLERNRRRKFGQNFLVDTKIAQSIVNAAQLEKTDEVLEIGPGDGALTSLLSKQAKSVIALEKDEIQASKLIPQFHGTSVHVIQADVLTYNYLENFSGEVFDGQKDFVVVSNLPYNAASHILQMLLTAQARPKRIIAMVQKEVAERMAAKPGDMSVLGVTIQWFAAVRSLFDVQPEAFVPRPKVISQVIELVPRKDSELLTAKDESQTVFRVVRMGFSSKRKKLSNNLSAGFMIPRETVENFLEEIGLKREVRAEELSLQNWLDVAKKLQVISSPVQK